ncbi:hypothetical protein [Thermococcus aciditolerans]|uniref:hypothetical protein n=1 Tax=Thermococcus aciditolerans TaxID=2598455 RepID=UPI00143D2411|nr:hypothetical protein [Thermococcus aciditolerans]
MGRLDIYIQDDVEKKFRELVKKLYGNRKGALSIAAEQAIKEWIKKVESEGQ